MKILVKMPNWFGDAVMSSAFFNKLKNWAPQATIDVIIREDLAEIVNYIPNIRRTYLITRENNKNYKEKYRFSRSISEGENYDIYFSLTDSFSSAFLGFFSGANQRVGFRNGLRSILFTKSIAKPADLHRVEEYILLLKLFFKKYGSFNGDLSLNIKNDNDLQEQILPTEYMIFNAASEASSRILPVPMATNLVNRYLEEFHIPIVFTRSKSHFSYYTDIIKNVKKESFCLNFAGRNSISELTQVMNGAKFIVSTDSGLAHLANALDKKLLVIFGAGNEFSTGPYNRNNAQIVRNTLECTPCVSNKCPFGTPKCLVELDVNHIVSRTKNLLTRKLVQETE